MLELTPTLDFVATDPDLRPLIRKIYISQPQLPPPSGLATKVALRARRLSVLHLRYPMSTLQRNHWNGFDDA